MFELMIVLVVVGSSLWVLHDASTLGVRKGLIPGNCDYGPGGWFIICLLLWIVGFPCYMNMRPKFIAVLDLEKQDQARLGPLKGEDLRRARLEEKMKEVRVIGGDPWPPPSAVPSPRLTPPAPQPIPCPYCSENLTPSSLREGSNTCPSCKRQFNIRYD